MHVAGALFFYHLGKYYKETAEGYVPVPAPIGARIELLPSGCTSVRVHGRRYFNCSEVYYEPYGNGFVVVEPPVPVENDALGNAGDQVSITASALNVRSGPGKRFQIISKLYRSQIVRVDSVDRDWYYVTMADGSSGWIMAKYTRLKTQYKNYNSNTKG